MGRHACLLLAVSLLIAADTKDAKTDKDKVQGGWTMVSGETNGKPAPDEYRKNFKMTFSGDKLTVKFSNDKTKEGTYKLDSSKKPKEITITPSDGEKPLVGIYDLDGDNLKLCMSQPGGDRPKEFAAKEGAGTMLLVLRRAKR
jgi:uncharacterized protein (TIGR03067 family)